MQEGSLLLTWLSVKTTPSGWPFSNMASDWLAALLSANQSHVGKLLLIDMQGFVLITPTPGSLLLTWLTLITAWISNHLPSKVWDEITYPFSNFQWLHHWSLDMDKQFHPTHYNGCNYLSMPGFKLYHVSKRGPGSRWVKAALADHIHIAWCKLYYLEQIHTSEIDY